MFGYAAYPVNCYSGIGAGVDCEGVWGDWGSCDAPCGASGQQIRHYVVTQQPSNGGSECPAFTDTKPCVGPPCPIDCGSHYGDFGQCIPHAGCGPSAGVQTAELVITTQPEYGGAACPPMTETQPCEIPCPVDCVSHYGDFGPCSADCGLGVQTAEIVITTQPEYGGAACPPTTKTQCCGETNPCEDAPLSCLDVAPPENWYLPGTQPGSGMGSDPVIMHAGTCAAVPSRGRHAVTICQDGPYVQQWTDGGPFYHCTGAASGGWGVGQANCCGLGYPSHDTQNANILAATRCVRYM